PRPRRGFSRPGPTYREAILMHAVARLVLHPLIANIQVSWVKLGPAGVADCLQAGVNDLGGTLMNESISRAAGASFGQEMPPPAMEALIAVGRNPRQRTTLYGAPSSARVSASRHAPPLMPVHNRSAREYDAGTPTDRLPASSSLPAGVLDPQSLETARADPRAALSPW
ncbi:MAG: hypothetical protein ACE5G3_13505, partial [Gammaproteobacteria bacterium]